MQQDEDGLGQSWFDELRWAWRFRQLTLQPLPWRTPSAQDATFWDEHPVYGRFGDFTVAIVVFKGRKAAIRERVWSGWPDPPTYCFLMLENDSVWAGRDFETWPRSWIKPV